MHQLCRKFHQVGKAHVEDRLGKDQVSHTPLQHAQRLSNPVFRAFDLVPEFSQIHDGFNVSFLPQSGHLGSLDTPASRTPFTADEGNWFFGDPYVLGLLEPDFSGVDFGESVPRS